VILQIDVTVTGPDGVMTGSAAVTVNDPPAGQAVLSPQTASPDLATLRMSQRSSALMRGYPRA
jgi:hypothetical protein